MKIVLRAAVIALAFPASAAFAQNIFHRSPETTGRIYTDAGYWQPVETQSAAGSSTDTSGNPAYAVTAPGPTAGPYYRGDDIRNANSALWGVGG